MTNSPRFSWAYTDKHIFLAHRSGVDLIYEQKLNRKPKLDFHSKGDDSEDEMQNHATR